MSIISDAMRLFWMPGLHEVSGKVEKRLAGWLASGQFVIYTALQSDAFELQPHPQREVCRAFAYDCSRMAIAAFESMDGIQRHPGFPKATAWLILRAYFGGFFAAHAVLRMLGISCTFLGLPEVAKVQQIADLFGFEGGPIPNKGFYRCSYEPKTGALLCTKADASSRGTHEIMWRAFHDALRAKSNALLKMPGISVTIQNVSTRLAEICDNLGWGPHASGGNWLSRTRNEANYRDAYGVWFPYERCCSYYESLFGIAAAWKKDPMQMTLWTGKGRDLQRFVGTCAAIVGLCREMVCDMSARCPTGRSFHHYGSIAFLNRAKVPC